MPVAPRQPDLVPLERRDVWMALIPAVVLALFAAFRIHTEACGQCHDDAIYVLTAQSLAEGNGYRLTQLPGEPPQTKYPPLYPVMLALLWKLWPSFPENLVLLQGFGILCSAVFLSLVYLYVVRFRHATRVIAFLSCLLCSIYGPFVLYSVVTMSEPLFGLFMVVMLWWIESAIRDPQPRVKNDLLGGLLLALPFLCRSIGLLFIPLSLFLLFRHGKRWRWALVGTLAAALPWILWTVSISGDWNKDPIQGYYTDYMGWWSSQGLPALARVISYNVPWVVANVSGPLMDGFTLPLLMKGHTGIWFLLNALPGMLALGMMTRELLRGRIPSYILASYILLVCVWPWMAQRFLMPLLPFLTVYLLRVLRLPLPRVIPGRTRLRLAVSVLAVAVLSSALLSSAAASVQSIHERHHFDTPNPEEVDDQYSWRHVRSLLDWIEIHSDPKDVLASGADPLLSLYTGRKAYYPIPCPPLAMIYGYPYPTEEIYALSLRAFDHYRPRYLVLTTGFHGEDQFRDWVGLVRERNPDLLHLVYTDEMDPRFAVYEIRHPSKFAIKP